MNDPARQERIEAATTPVEYAFGSGGPERLRAGRRQRARYIAEDALEAAFAVPPVPRFDEGDPVYLTAEEREWIETALNAYYAHPNAQLRAKLQAAQPRRDRDDFTTTVEGAAAYERQHGRL